MKKIKLWRLRSKVFVVLVLIFIGFAAYSCVSQSGEPRFSLAEDVTFPSLTGSYPVGKALYHVVDPEHVDEMPDATETREWMIRVFYPAQPAPEATSGPYVAEPLRSVLAEARAKDGSAAIFDRIHAHAYVEAPVAPNAGGYPVLLFSPGGGEQPLFYTSLLEEIASHGYVVAAVPEPHDTPVIAFPDGRVKSPVKMGPKQMVACLCQEPRCLRLMLGDKETIAEIMYEMRDNRPLDLVSTLNYLTELNASDPLLGGHLNLERVGAFGHSYGGASAARVAAIDLRFKAVAVLDSNIFLVIHEDDAPLSQPVLYLASAGVELDAMGRKITREQTEKTLAYLQQSGAFYGVKIAGTAHQNIQTDWALLAPYADIFAEAGVIKAIDGPRAWQIISQYTLTFFDRHLRGLDTSLFNRLAPDYPEVMTCCEF